MKEIKIRQARESDNNQLIVLQEDCPMGTDLIITLVNKPDFFARAKAHKRHWVLVAEKGSVIVGTAGCALRQVELAGQTFTIGYEFDYSVHPDHRREGIASQLHCCIEEILKKEGCLLSFAFILEGNLPSQKLFERQGFHCQQALVMPVCLVFEEMQSPILRNIRPMNISDLSMVVSLINQTWQGYDFFKPLTEKSFLETLRRVPVALNNVYVLEKEGEIKACLGFGDWASVCQITVKSLNRELRIKSCLLKLMGLFKSLPKPPGPGDLLSQWFLDFVGFEQFDQLTELLRFLNNLALKLKIGQIITACDRESPILGCFQALTDWSFLRVEVELYLYLKWLGESTFSIKKIFVDPIDL